MQIELTVEDVLRGEKEVSVELLTGVSETVTLKKVAMRKVMKLAQSQAKKDEDLPELVLLQSLPEGKGEDWLDSLTFESLGGLQQLAVGLSVSGVNGVKKMQEAARAAMATASSIASAPSAT